MAKLNPPEVDKLQSIKKRETGYQGIRKQKIRVSGGRGRGAGNNGRPMTEDGVRTQGEKRPSGYQGIGEQDSRASGNQGAGVGGQDRDWLIGDWILDTCDSWLGGKILNSKS